jgi:hypothetical protein
MNHSYKVSITANIISDPIPRETAEDLCRRLTIADIPAKFIHTISNSKGHIICRQERVWDSGIGFIKK